MQFDVGLEHLESEKMMILEEDMLARCRSCVKPGCEETLRAVIGFTLHQYSNDCPVSAEKFSCKLSGEQLCKFQLMLLEILDF